jgi:hypothetical protein
MQNHSKYYLLVLLAATTLTLSSCKKDEAEPEDENELITTVRVKFTENGTTNSVTGEWKDPDGDGGAAPTITPISLKVNKTYQVTVDFLDESKSPVKSITEEIVKEADEHLVVFTVASNVFTYAYGDKDSRGFPIGLVGTAKTGTSPSSGSLRVQLRHQPPVNGTPTKNGTSAPGSSDADISFNVAVAP